MAGKTLTLDIKLDGKLDPSVTAAFTKLAGMATKAAKQTQMVKIGESVNKIAGASQKLMGAIVKSGLVIGGVIGAIGAKSISLTSDLQEVQNVVDVTFGKNAEQVNAWSKSVLDGFGMSELSAKQYSSSIGSIFKGMGIEGQALMEMSQGVTQLTGDVASFKNMSLEDVFVKLTGIATGETEALKGIGVVMTQANLKAYAMSRGITTNIDDMTQAEKVTLRYSFVMDTLKDAQGDFARTQGNFANQLRLAKENVNKLFLSIGEKLLPIITPMIQQFNDFIKAIPPGKIQEMTDKFAGLAQSGLKGISDFIVNEGPKIMGVITFMIDHSDLIIAGILGIAAATGALTLAQLYFNIAAAANPFTWIILAIIAAIAIVTAAIYLLWANWDSVVKFLGDCWNRFVLGLQLGWQAAWDGIVWAFKGAINLIIGGLNGLMSFTIGIVNGITSGINVISGAIGIPAIPQIPVPQIPMLAIGATVSAPMLAMIGEAGTETVVPHNNKPRSRALAMDAARGAGLRVGGDSVVININLHGTATKKDGESVIDAIENYFASRERVSYG